MMTTAPVPTHIVKEIPPQDYVWSHSLHLRREKTTTASWLLIGQSS